MGFGLGADTDGVSGVVDENNHFHCSNPLSLARREI